jgi:amidase
MTAPIISEYDKFDALGLADLVKRREVTAAELVNESIRRIELYNEDLNAVVSHDFERALTEAKLCPSTGVFSGVPFLVKDMVTSWKENPMSWSCPYFKDLVSPADMVLTSRLRSSGLIPIGNTHVPELGWSLSSESEMYGVTHNPWHQDVTAGGSSGGSAAAVAARMVPIADASDAAGSIRVPASNNGLVGLKPSRGRITLSPNTVDLFCGGAQVHCVSRTVRDSAAFLDVTCGGLQGEPYLLPDPSTSFLNSIHNTPSRLRVGFTLSSPSGEPLHNEVKKSIEKTVRVLEALGYEVEEYDLKFDFAKMWSNYCDVVAVHTAALFDSMAPVVGHAVSEKEVSPTIWSMLQKANEIGSVKHAEDVDGVRLASVEIAEELHALDIFICPVMTNPPRKLGHWNMNEPDIDHYNENMMWDCAFTAPFNVSGQPAISVPMHWTDDGLPVGVQLVGRHGDEALLFQLAAQLELQEKWHQRAPKLLSM